MMDGPAHVTLTKVAAAAKVSPATASWSLRNDPRIPRVTADRVQAVAKRLGYRPNPRVSALMAHIRQSKPVTVGERIAFLWLDAPPGERPYRTMFDAANKHATQLGYTLEEFWLRSPGLTARRLQQILHSRGIVGLVISPSDQPNPQFKIEWDWSLFSAVVLGTAQSEPELHHSAHHHYAAMRLVMLKLQAAGKRRIVGLLNKRIEERARRAWSSAFLGHHPRAERAWEFLAREDIKDVHSHISWIAKRKPDAIVTVGAFMELLFDHGWRPAPKTTIVLLDSAPNRWGFSGIDQCEQVIATNAVDLVAHQLHCNERGIPSDVKMVLFAGRWVSGKNFPQKHR